jgi:hypothetical protein
MWTTNDEVIKVAKRAFPEYRGRTFRFKAFEPMRLVSYWDGGSRDWYAFVNLLTGDVKPLGQFMQPSQLEALPENCVLVEHVIFCGKDLGLRVYAPAENIRKLLPVVPDIALTGDQLTVLKAIGHLKSAYRLDQIRRQFRYGSPEEAKWTKEYYQSVVDTLKPLGLVSNNGGISNEGRNYLESLA